MIEQIGPSNTFQASGSEGVVPNRRVSLGVNDRLVSRRKHPPLVRKLRNFGKMIWEIIKTYFLFFLFDAERDAAKESAKQLNLFFNHFIDAQKQPTEENINKIKLELSQLSTDLRRRVKESLLCIIKEQMQPDKSSEEHQKTLKEIIENPLFVYENDKGHEPCVMGQAIARATESFHIII